MKVVCKIDNWNEITDKGALRRIKKYINLPDGETYLDLGKEYTVYGIVFWDSAPWYYICSELGLMYPEPFAAELFEVSCPRLSSCWRLHTHASSYTGPISSLVLPEWAENPIFYERLIDGEPEEEETFKRYRFFMDNEF
ncbi:MAG: hypothetical protein L7U87_05440 [Chlamydiales bacterium]|nr:hypothetical protein [Chlamydiales bacterium]